MAALRLAVNNTVSVPHHRPFQTMYYRSATNKVQDWARVGRASSNIGAIRAAVVRLVTGQYYKAVVHGPTGEVMYTLIRRRNVIKICGLFMQMED